MSEKFVNIDRETPMLLPVDMREWLPEDHLAHFLIEVVGSMDLSSFSVNGRGTGSAQYPPSMLLALLVYCYATGRFSSRVIEQASYYTLEKILGEEEQEAALSQIFRDNLSSLAAI